MEIQINKIKGKRVNQTTDSVIISEGSLTYSVKNNEYCVDVDNIDDVVITDSPEAAPDLLAACEKIRDTAKSWEGRKEAPYWNLGDIAAAAVAKARGEG